MIRLLVVEDHPAVAEGLAALLQGEPEVDLVGTASNAEQATLMIERSAPAVVLCDVVLGGDRAGLDLLGRLGGTRAPAFIMFSAYAYPDYYVTAQERGAAGYLLKMATIQEIMAAIRAVAAGGTAFSAEAIRTMRQARRRPTPRQAEIIELVAAGHTNDQIATALGIHIKTVEGQMRRLFDRYDVTNRTELVMVAEREGWIAAPHDTPKM